MFHKHSFEIRIIHYVVNRGSRDYSQSQFTNIYTQSYELNVRVEGKGGTLEQTDII